MTRRVTTAVLAALLCFSAHAASASEVKVPDTDAARASADLIARAKRALSGFVAACATGEDESLRKLTTDDIRIEYALDEPGTFLNVDASSGTVGCGALNGPDGRLENLWILPTNDTSSVFVQYDTGEGRRLALVEMRGDRIARMVSYASAPPALLANAAAATAMPCVRFSERK
jgi:hypothetical protein